MTLGKWLALSESLLLSISKMGTANAIGGVQGKPVSAQTTHPCSGS